jgi:hypothetical protein
MRPSDIRATRMSLGLAIGTTRFHDWGASEDVQSVMTVAWWKRLKERLVTYGPQGMQPSLNLTCRRHFYRARARLALF